MIRRRHGWLWLLTLVLSACATGRPGLEEQARLQALYEQRAADIAAWTHWGFRGRLSLDDGSDGGSGQLDWQAKGKSSQLDFRGTMGRGAWRLTLDPGTVLLERSDGSRTHASSVDELLSAELGWKVPVDALAWWVRGLRAPGAAKHVEFDPEGRIVRLEQADWIIEFERYRSVLGVELPGRIEAVRGNYRLKLVPARWTAPAAEDAHV